MQQETTRNVYVPLDRTFHSLSPTEDPENPWSGYAHGAIPWTDLLQKRRVVLLSEAGSGKTEEVEQASHQLRAEGKAAFFLRLEHVIAAFEDAFEVGTYDEFEAWLSSTGEGWLLLDSIDEAMLKSPGDFQLAVKKIGRIIDAAKDRVNIVITGRMFAWQPHTDLAHCQTHLSYTPIRKMGEFGPADGASHSRPSTPATNGSDQPDFEIFGIDNLTEYQIGRLAGAWGVNDTTAFLEEIERTDTSTFASRPQDLMELTDFWLDQGRIGTRSEIVSNSIARRLRERDPKRRELRPLAEERARRGAMTLAAASTLTQIQTVRVPDATGGLPGLDLRDILPDWDERDQQTLLSRPLFDGAVYGAQRFHHRSVREYLTAEWFAELLGRHTSRRTIEALFFTEQYGIEIVVPALRPILPWLIIMDERMLERVRRIAPEIVFEGGDPAKLLHPVRSQILREVCALMAGGDAGRSMRDFSAVQRFASEDLSTDIAELLRTYAGNADLTSFLLRMIWLGKIKSLKGITLDIAVRPDLERYTRITAIRAVGAVGTTADMASARAAFLTEAGPLQREWFSELIDASAADADVVGWLAACLEKSAKLPEHSHDSLPDSIKKMIGRCSSDLLPLFVTVFDRLLGLPPYVDRRWCEISTLFEWLLEPAAHLLKRMIDERHPGIFSADGLALLRKVSTGRSYGRSSADDVPRMEVSVRKWSELNRELFWFEVSRCRRETEADAPGERLIDFWPALYRSFCQLDRDDFDYITNQITARPLLDDRLVALSQAVDIYRSEGRPAAWRRKLRSLTDSETALVERLDQFLQPPKKSEPEKRHQAMAARWKRQDAERTLKEAENLASWKEGLSKGLDVERAALLKYAGQVTNAVYYLFQQTRNAESHSNRWTTYNWQALIPEYGEPAARFYRDAAVGFWRQFTPQLRSEGWPSNTTANATIIGLAGLEIEATEVPGWPSMLTPDEVDLACRYASHELNGFPTWFPTLFATFPDRVTAFLIQEIRYELTLDANLDANYILSDLQWSGQWAWEYLAPQLLALLESSEPDSLAVLDRILNVIQGSNIADLDIDVLARAKCRTVTAANHLARWQAVLTGVAPQAGIAAAKSVLATMARAESVKFAMTYVTTIWGGRFEDRTRIRAAFKTPEYLKDLFLLVTAHVQIAEDLDRANGGVYSPELRDHAQGARDRLFELLREIPGKASFMAIMDIATAHPDEASRPWMLHHAKTKAELDGDMAPWSSQQVIDFEREMERTPANHRELAELALLRLEDFRDDVENGDESIARLLQRVELETEMRNYIAHVMRDKAANRYRIAQEEEFADAKRTDIRFQGTTFDGPFPVELKLADGWSGADLIERLENQLCGGYLRDRHSSRGLFLLVNLDKGGWDVPNAPKRVDFAGLLDSLRRHWEAISSKFPGIDGITVVGIDLRKRFQ